MAGSKEGAKKARETKIKKAGGLEAYKKQMKEMQSKGGSAVRRGTRSFEVDPALAAQAGAKGRANRYYKGKVQG